MVGEGKTISVIKMKKQFDTYKKLSTEFYDSELVQRENREQVLSFYMDYAKKANGPILEPMCGSGRFLLPILKEGFDIEGFDASPQMLDALRKRNQEAVVWEQFVEEFSSDKKYALIFVPFGSWGLITDKEKSKAALQNMFDHLRPGGKLILEIETTASVPQPCGVPHIASHLRADGTELRLTMTPTYDAKVQIFSADCAYEVLNVATVVQKETEKFRQYLFAFDEMDHILKEVGFYTIKKYKNYSKNVATNSHESILIYEAVR
jgi:SAM-dependent methyltransferase